MCSLVLVAECGWGATYRSRDRHKVRCITQSLAQHQCQLMKSVTLEISVHLPGSTVSENVSYLSSSDSSYKASVLGTVSVAAWDTMTKSRCGLFSSNASRDQSIVQGSQGRSRESGRRRGFGWVYLLACLLSFLIAPRTLIASEHWPWDVCHQPLWAGLSITLIINQENTPQVDLLGAFSHLTFPPPKRL